MAGFLMMLFRGHQNENVDNPIATQPHIEASMRELDAGISDAGISDAGGLQIFNDGEPTVSEATILDERTACFTEDPAHATDRSLALLPAGTDR